MTVDILTFGCRLNALESEGMRREVGNAGLADTIVVNTCAVTGEAVRQARQAIRRLHRHRPDARIVVTGCAAQTEPATFAAMPEVDRVVGNGGKLQPRTWEEIRDAFGVAAPARAGTAAKIAVDDIMAVKTASPLPVDAFEGRARALVQVQNGCDHRCTFCVIPFGRGNSRSVPVAEVVAQVRRLVDNGYREVVLSGVDITSYGADLAGAPRLGGLVKSILAQVPELARLRLSTVDSIEADPALFDAIACEPRLMPHLHLSLQSGDDLILKRMKRRHRRADAISFCEMVRRLRPNVVFGADLIAGFPTETEEMFRRSLDLIERCGLVHLHVFPFSPRPGTPAARMPQVPRELARERAQRLRESGRRRLARHLDAEVGARRRVLAETSHSGRTEHFTPVTVERAIMPGALVDVDVIGHDGAKLLGQ